MMSEHRHHLSCWAHRKMVSIVSLAYLLQLKGVNLSHVIAEVPQALASRGIQVPGFPLVWWVPACLDRRDSWSMTGIWCVQGTGGGIAPLRAGHSDAAIGTATVGGQDRKWSGWIHQSGPSWRGNVTCVWVLTRPRDRGLCWGFMWCRTLLICALCPSMCFRTVRVLTAERCLMFTVD